MCGTNIVRGVNTMVNGSASGPSGGYSGMPKWMRGMMVDTSTGRTKEFRDAMNAHYDKVTAKGYIPNVSNVVSWSDWISSRKKMVRSDSNPSTNYDISSLGAPTSRPGSM